MSRKLHVVILLSIILLPWLIGSGNFFYLPKSDYSDLAISHLPNATYLVNSIRVDGAIPIWSNAILSGAPFAADPLSGIWYPPGWLAYFLPQPFGFNLVVILHFVWGGFGLFLLLLKLGMKRGSALFGAVAFLLMPKLYAHLAAGNISLVYAVCWTPWFFLAEAGRDPAAKTTIFQRIMPGVILGLIFLADSRWIVYSALGWLCFSVWRTFSSEAKRPLLITLREWLPKFGLQVLVALGLSAALLVPMMEFSRLSTRSSLTVADVLNFSLPPAQLVGVFLPDIGGYAEWQVYPGALIFLFTLYALAAPSVRRRAKFWLVMAGIGLIVSLGSMWPGAEIIASLPFVDLTRVPSRAWFLVGISMIIVAAYAFDSLTVPHPDQAKRSPQFYLFIFPSLAVLITAGLALTGQVPPVGFIWGSITLATGYALIVLMRKYPTAQIWATAVIIFVVLDLGGVNWLGIKLRSADEVFSEGRKAAEFLAAQPGVFRVYSPSYSIPQQTAAAYGLELVDGINPLQLRTYSDFMKGATGVENDAYSVTQPAFDTASPETDNAAAIPDAGQLGLLNAKYIVSAFEINLPSFVLVWQDEETHVYENLEAIPRAWLQNANLDPGDGLIREIELVNRTSDRMTFQADGGGLAVFSIPDYPGWEVLVDGRVVEKLRIANLLIGVNLTEGQHEIILQFSPTILKWSEAVSIMAWLVVIIIAWISLRKGIEG